MAQPRHREDAPVRFEWELQQIEFDKSTIASPRFGFVASRVGGSVEVFRGWVVFGQEVHNIEANGRFVRRYFPVFLMLKSPFPLFTLVYPPKELAAPEC